MSIENENDDVEFELDGVDIEVEDDTPPEDRNRAPLPKEIVDELEADELDDYSDKVKVRLKQMKKVWHDERREKERATREQQEALAFANKMLEENKRLRGNLSQGENTLVESFKQSAEMELNSARKEYKEAYESGDSERLLEANEKLQGANYRLEQLRNYRPALQAVEQPVYNTQEPAAPQRLDQKTTAWQERNSWWGTDPEMTASALGLHQKLEKERGAQFVGSDEYWQTIDKTMQRRFPEYFGEAERPKRQDSRAAVVVAPASRSTSSRKVVLKQSQISIAKRLGLTPEQYAREFAKMEK